MIDYYGIVREFGMPAEEQPPLPQPERKWFGLGPWGNPHPAWQLTAMMERRRNGMTMWRMAAEIHRLRAIESAARRMVTAQERMGQGSWFPSEEDIRESDMAWDELRAALDTPREEG